MGPMAFRVQTKSQSNRVSVVVETAEEALAKIAEFAELGYDVVVRDMLGTVIDAASLAMGKSPEEPSGE